LRLLKKHGMKLNLKKCNFAKESYVYMGYVITYDSAGNPIVTIEKSKNEAIQKIPVPTTIRKVKSFCGMVLYLAKFLPHLATLLKPIFELTKKQAKGLKFKWSAECESNFQEIKNLIQRAPVQYPPSKDGKFIVYVDTSRTATGASLYQIQGGEERLIGYHSKTLDGPAINYSVSELELTGLYINLKAFKSLLTGTNFSVVTDHSAIVGILNSKAEPATNRTKCFLEKLSEMSFTVGTVPFVLGVWLMLIYSKLWERY
jgi:hypothetical protein